MTETAVHVIVKGRVQGVWFRAWTRQEATKLGLRGWVRNRRDGTVEAVVCGEESEVDEMVRLLHQGSPASRVDHVEVSPADLPEEPEFVQISTA